jgi:hypothetical protein
MEEFERPLMSVSLVGSSSAICDLGCILRDGIGSILGLDRLVAVDLRTFSEWAVKR